MEETQKTKEELLKEMQHHQQEYQKLSAELKKIKAVSDAEEYAKKQRARLEEFRAKYKFFTDAKGEVKEIEWDGVAKLIEASLPTMAGYCLGYDFTGTPGLILVQDGNAVSFDPVVEEESDCRKYAEREEKRLEYAANAARNKK